MRRGDDGADDQVDRSQHSWPAPDRCSSAWVIGHTRGVRGGARLETRSGPQVTLVDAGGEDLADLGKGVLELGLGVEEVRAESQADVGPEVAEDLALCKLLVDALEPGNA